MQLGCKGAPGHQLQRLSEGDSRQGAREEDEIDQGPMLGGGHPGRGNSYAYAVGKCEPKYQEKGGERWHPRHGVHR